VRGLAGVSGVLAACALLGWVMLGGQDPDAPASTAPTTVADRSAAVAPLVAPPPAAPTV